MGALPIYTLWWSRGDGLGIHIGKILNRQVGDEVIAESRQLSVQTAALRLIPKGIDDEIPDEVSLPGHAPGELPGCTHTLGLVG
jgi:hypothetical protein